MFLPRVRWTGGYRGHGASSRRRLPGFVLLLVALVAAACTSSTQTTSPTPGASSTAPSPGASSTSAVASGGTLVVGVSGDFENFDPCIGGSPRTTEVVASTYENAVGFKTEESSGGFKTQVLDDQNGWVPALAQSVDISPDFTTYTFHLRPDVKFTQTGNPMTADDWIYSWRRMLSKPGIGFCPFENSDASITSIKQVKKIDDMTVQITVPKDTNRLTLANMRLVDFAIVDSKEVQKHATPGDPFASKWLATHSAGTGPYYIQSSTPGGELVLARDPNYWGGTPPGAYDKVIMKVIPDLATRVSLMQSGDLDMAENIPPREAVGLSQQPGITLVDVPVGNRISIGLDNTTPPFDNINVRNALADALPVDDIIKTVYFGKARPYKSYVLEGVPGYDGSTYKPTYNLDEARKALQAAGVSNLNLTLTVNSAFPDYQDIATLYQASLAQIGVSVKIQTLQPADFVGKWYGQKLTFFIQDGISWIDDPGTVTGLWMWSKGFSDFSHFSNARVDALYDQWNTKPDSPERQAAFAEVQRIFNSATSVAYVCLNDFLLPMKSSIKGYTLYKDTNTHFGDLYAG
jgi:peptide/nickel transport system substrate-binding protein